MRHSLPELSRFNSAERRGGVAEDYSGGFALANSLCELSARARIDSRLSDYRETKKRGSKQPMRAMKRENKSSQFAETVFSVSTRTHR